MLEVGLRRRADHMDRLDRLGVIVNTSVTVERITPEGVWIQNQLGGKHRVEVDSVILSGTPVADTRLFDAISPLVPESYAIGDCTGLGLIAKATTEAMRVACSL
jgi:2,4-dienoyl-CoA reductase (NADPH2)